MERGAFQPTQGNDMSIEFCTARAARRMATALLMTAVLSLVSIPSEATPLDKLAGQSITVGNLVFSNFSWPSFVSASPSNIDVQGIVVTDPVTGAQQAGLRFVVIQSGVAMPFSLSPQGGPHEIVLNVIYSVTDLSGQLATIAHSINATVAGQAGVFVDTDASRSFGVTEGQLADPALTMMVSSDWFGAVGSSSSSASPDSFYAVASNNLSLSAPLFPGIATYYVKHQVQLAISNRKGVPGGTVTLQGWDALLRQ
jgi:hypothetical protein